MAIVRLMWKKNSRDQIKTNEKQKWAADLPISNRNLQLIRPFNDVLIDVNTTHFTCKNGSNINYENLMFLIQTCYATAHCVA